MGSRRPLAADSLYGAEPYHHNAQASPEKTHAARSTFGQGVEKPLGGVDEAGKLADLGAVPGNPLDDITVTERVSFVMLGGEIFKREQQ